jgi:hypothetical protein
MHDFHVHAGSTSLQLSTRVAAFGAPLLARSHVQAGSPFYMRPCADLPPNSSYSCLQLKNSQSPARHLSCCQHAPTACCCVIPAVLQCLPFQTLMEAWQAQPASDIVAVGVQLLRNRMRLLSGMLRTGMVKAEVRWAGALPAGPCTNSHQCEHHKCVLSLDSKVLQLARKHSMLASCTTFMVGNVDPVLLANDCSTSLLSAVMHCD